jgi:putative Ca2+/H+ antiporter (TMEM165/GDT1 family)
MKVFITIIAGIIAFTVITALTAAAFAVIFCGNYTDVVQSTPFIALAIFVGMPTAGFIASEIYDKNLIHIN